LEYSHDRTIRQFVAPEIFEAFVGLQLPEEMENLETFAKFRKEYCKAVSDSDAEFRRIKEILIKSGENVKECDRLTLISKMSEKPKFRSLLEKLAQMQKEIERIESNVMKYWETVECFSDFVNFYIAKKGNWIGYIRNFEQEKRTSSLDALAYINDLKVVIWVKENNSDFLRIVHSFDGSRTSSYSSHDQSKCSLRVVHMLHTLKLSHFNLLTPVLFHVPI
jgi:hypothetical protein